MKCALLLEKDQASCAKTADTLKWLGYMVAPVHSPHEALRVVGALRFDLIVTCTATKPDDRRSLTGELKRSAPNAAIVLIADDAQGDEGRPRNYAGISAVVKRPTSLEGFRKVLEYQLDHELQPACRQDAQERRKGLFKI